MTDGAAPGQIQLAVVVSVVRTELQHTEEDASEKSGKQKAFQLLTDRNPLSEGEEEPATLQNSTWF